MTRRRILGAIAILILNGACRRNAERCAYCGMKIEGTSAWLADLELADGAVRHFDSPRCALRAWRGGRFDAKSIRVIEYYDRRWRDGADVVFVVGSDVEGPMGPDLVPVDPQRAQKFADDHAAGRPLAVAQITADLLASLR